MNLLDVFAGFIASAFAAMGVGGGGLLIIYLTEFLNMEQRLAQGINLLFFLCASVTALSVHLRKRRILFRYALFFAIGGAFGAILGCLMADYVSDTLLRKAFGVLLIYAGGATLYKTLSTHLKRYKTNSKKPRPR